MGDLLLLRRAADPGTTLPGLPSLSTPRDREARDRATADALRAYLRACGSTVPRRVDVRL